jgi:hypothetical protein
MVCHDCTQLRVEYLWHYERGRNVQKTYRSCLRVPRLYYVPGEMLYGSFCTWLLRKAGGVLTSFGSYAHRCGSRRARNMRRTGESMCQPWLAVRHLGPSGGLRGRGRSVIMTFGRRGVAQSGSALEWGSRGRTFESYRPDLGRNKSRPKQVNRKRGPSF